MKSMRATAVAMLTLFSPPLAAQWHVEQAQISSGAAVSASAHYRLQGCIDHDPAGRASSANYTVYAGCGASSLLLGADVIDATADDAVAIPAMSPSATFAATLLMTLAALLAMRRRAAFRRAA